MRSLSEKLIQACAQKGLKLATVESCTGGLIAGAITDVPGASAVLERGFVTYSNEAKQEMLGVPAETIHAHGAVSEATAKAMAKGALAHSKADIALSVTGIAGPGTEGTDKPVGLVWFGLAGPDGRLESFHHIFDGDRTDIRAQAVETGLEALLRRAAPLTDRPKNHV
ncbi:MAG: CinA family protein [Pseudomonadota bacterium]